MIRCQFCRRDNPAANAECEHCGAVLSMPAGSVTARPELEKQIQNLLEQGKKIEVIKRFREKTGAGIKEARDAVEAIEMGRPLSPPARVDESFQSELTELLQNGKKIEAIQRFREATGAGLKEAKDAVEAIEMGRPLSLPAQVDESFQREITELLQNGRKIEAINRLREETGAGLKEAKDAIEQFGAKHGLPLA